MIDLFLYKMQNRDLHFL